MTPFRKAILEALYGFPPPSPRTDAQIIAEIKVVGQNADYWKLRQTVADAVYGNSWSGGKTHDEIVGELQRNMETLRLYMDPNSEERVYTCKVEKRLKAARVTIRNLRQRLRFSHSR